MKILWLILAALILPSCARAQCSVVTENTLLGYFTDSGAPGRITPALMRNFVCSVPTLLDNNTYSGAQTFNGGGTLAGNWAGTPTFTGVPVFSNGASLSGTFTGTSTFNVGTLNGLTIGHGNGAVTSNIAFGTGVLAQNSTGHDNFAAGTSALTLSTTASQNIAIGNSALSSLLTAQNNIGIGYFALASATGTQNIGIGTQAGSSGTTGQGNISIGHQAGNTFSTGSFNVLLGYQSGTSLSTGSDNVIIGGNSGSTIAASSNNIIISDGAGGIGMSAASTKNWTIPSGGSLTVVGGMTATTYTAGATAGVDCSGSPSVSFAATKGIVTHC